RQAMKDHDRGGDRFVLDAADRTGRRPGRVGRASRPRPRAGAQHGLELPFADGQDRPEQDRGTQRAARFPAVDGQYQPGVRLTEAARSIKAPAEPTAPTVPYREAGTDPAGGPGPLME